MSREIINKLLIVFDNADLEEIEFYQFKELYDFESLEPQIQFTTALQIIKHRLKRNTQTPFNNEAIELFAKKNGLKIPFNLRDFNALSTEILFGLVNRD